VLQRLMRGINVVSALVNGLSPRLDAWVSEQRWCHSAIVVAEIRYGRERRPELSRWRAQAEGAMEALEILPWTNGCAMVYGRLRLDPERN
jgi:tRNA(fMet)-specific endonuclease VapC